jgi:hypothetical protein
MTVLDCCCCCYCCCCWLTVPQSSLLRSSSSLSRQRNWHERIDTPATKVNNIHPQRRFIFIIIIIIIILFLLLLIYRVGRSSWELPAPHVVHGRNLCPKQGVLRMMTMMMMIPARCGSLFFHLSLVTRKKGLPLVFFWGR